MQNNLDLCLSELSTSLFHLDDVSRRIMEIIARNGPSTVYQLERHTRSRPSIYRRLRGEGNFISLLEYDFVAKEQFEKLPTGHWKTHYGFRLKGLLVSLSHIELDQTYLARPFFNDIVHRSKDEDMREIYKNYVKSELALWMQLHLENGLMLTHVKNGERWYRSSRKFMFSLGPPPGYEVGGVLSEEFSETIKSSKVTMANWALKLQNKLDAFSPELSKQLKYEIGDWPQYMRLLHQFGKEWVDKYLEREHPIGEPSLTIFPQYLDLMEKNRDVI